ncbi:MAG: hypothetical protein H6657_24120 [Ardenticatenaceae bacterium]|nr:hypothetical protein [Ardenticatenaceae bacterium]
MKKSWLGFSIFFLVACASAVATPTSTPGPTPTPFPAPELLQEVGMITYFQMMMADGTLLEYGVVLPDDFVDGQTYPVLLAFPPGVQSRAMVNAGMDYWAEVGQERGWVVVSPVAPGGVLFFDGSEKYMPEFLQRIEALYPLEGGQFHLAGISNGGISSFRIATMMPEKFASLTAVPGFPQPFDFEQLAKLTQIPVTLFVGENDTSWVERMTATADELERLGGQVSLTVVPNEGHVIRSLTGETLYDILDAFRAGK